MDAISDYACRMAKERRLQVLTFLSAVVVFCAAVILSRFSFVSLALVPIYFCVVRAQLNPPRLAWVLLLPPLAAFIYSPRDMFPVAVLVLISAPGLVGIWAGEAWAGWNAKRSSGAPRSA